MKKYGVTWKVRLSRESFYPGRRKQNPIALFLEPELEKVSMMEVWQHFFSFIL
jgi:hypothetical protein